MRSSPPRSTGLRAVTIVIALLVIAAMVAPAVLAHAQLLSSDPANGANLATTDAVSLTFNEDINPDFVQIVAEGPQGDVADGDPVVAGPVVTQPIAPTASGAHTVTYRVVSADGHPVSGSVTFTLTAVAPETATETVTAEPTSAEPTTGTATDEPETPAPATPVSNDEAVASATGADEDEGGSTAWLVAGAVAALAAVGGGIAWAARSRRHPEH
jgi:methionine-rich copper-binding protein CopC